MVEGLIVEDGVCQGVVTRTGQSIYAKTVILPQALICGGKSLSGNLEYESGPNNQQPSVTSRKIWRNWALNWSALKREHLPGSTVIRSITARRRSSPVMKSPGLFLMKPLNIKTISSHAGSPIPRKNPSDHQDNLHRSPMYSGMIKGRGTRYCPSIEDKVVRFHDKPRHQIFLEPEGRIPTKYMFKGLSTSCRKIFSKPMLRSIPGLEKARMMRAGYAIEYDAIVPTQLWPSWKPKR